MIVIYWLVKFLLKIQIELFEPEFIRYLNKGYSISAVGVNPRLEYVFIRDYPEKVIIIFKAWDHNNYKNSSNLTEQFT